ncbi:RNA-binding protein [Ignicoccus pacificus DSM 13166]|uniref:RNA-binding protein n=1 Tax=Ignicoccus pacificus DSM 13166 TaxID=940294 RepID=A0A977PK68_9CREN|nr:RNA-binding protein [Ignicoccus pacificus DSM 13166]
MVRVRVRGIYATAIASLLLEKGFELSDVSKKLSERLGGVEGSPLPPHVTVKHSDRNVHEVLVNGFYKEGTQVYETLKELFPLAPRYVAKPNLHSAYKIVVDENCKTTIEGIEAEVRSRECYPGKEMIAEVIRSKVYPKDKVVLEEGLRLEGFYVEVILGRGQGVSFSKHITNLERKALLINLASDIVSMGIKVHWRSSARSAELEALREELERLVQEAQKIWVRARDLPPGTKVYEGEFLGIFKTTLEDKKRADEQRRKVLSTMPFHHTLKAGGDKFSTAAELGDKVVPFDWNLEGKVKEFLLEKCSDCKNFEIRHEKLDGSCITLGPGRVIGTTEKYLVMKRIVREYGIYDGINVKKEPGDFIITLIEPFSPFVIHGYFSEMGDLKGVYVNINSDVEIGECFARYVDMEVDVVYDGMVRVIDKEELEKYSGHLSPEALRKVEKAVKIAKERLESGEWQRELKGLAA